MRITKHFTTEEMGLTETEPMHIIVNICNLVHNVLEPIRKIINKPIIVNSGYRNSQKNKTVGGTKYSQHMYGEAADITTGKKEDLFEIYKILESSNIEFDQLILYRPKNFIHISYNSVANRKQIIIK